MPAIDSPQKPSQFDVEKGAVGLPPTETLSAGNNNKQHQGRKMPIDATSYNVGIINIVQFGGASNGRARPKVETKEANELTT